MLTTITVLFTIGFFAAPIWHAKSVIAIVAAAHYYVFLFRIRTVSEEEKAQWQLFSNRAERLHDHVEMLREYLVQIRELYQSLIAVQQNQVMSILTVVTTIFLPLTLIAGWYGMNFPNMPEFGWKYAYPAVIIVSVLVIILEIIYFKKKKML